MSQKSTKKRSKANTGVKIFIAAASVAATVGGWALLPFNDPSAAAGAAPAQNQQPALSVPSNSDSGLTNGATQAPQVQVPAPSSDFGSPNSGFSGGFSSLPSPFTHTRSSR